MAVTGEYCELNVPQHFGPIQARQIAWRFDVVAEEVAKRMEVNAPAPIPVEFLYSDWIIRAGIPAMALPDGARKILMTMTCITTQDHLFDSIAAHELTHIYMEDFNPEGSELNHMLHEGMARHMEEQFLPVGFVWPDVANVEGCFTPELLRLSRKEVQELPPAERYEFYRASIEFVRLVGFEKLLRLIHSGEATLPRLELFVEEL